MIRRFSIRNFKSLVDFTLLPGEVPLGQFTCLVGLNGSGKSSVLQAFDFVGRLANGSCAEWVKSRGWEWSELQSRFHGRRRKHIGFRIEFSFRDLEAVVWEGEFDVATERCSSETIQCGTRDVMTVGRGEARLMHRDNAASTEYVQKHLSYVGSILTVLRLEESEFHPAIGAVKAYAASLRSMDLLNPQAMKQRSRDGEELGSSGERLSAYLYDLKLERRERLAVLLREFYPQLEDIETRSMRFGWRDLSVQERWQDSNGKGIETQARHMNDGMLRLLGILAQTQFSAADGPPKCVLFDEIENGINPELTKRLVETLRSACDQVVVTTHSPLILNWLPDTIAREAVVFIYRTTEGHTRAVRFFDLPSARRRLGVLGAGEAFVDVNLVSLAEEAAAASGNEG